MTPADVPPPWRRPAGRYGRQARGPGRSTVVAAGLVAGLLVTWLGYVAFGPGNPGVHFADLSYVVLDDGHVQVTFTVRKDPERTAVCTVRARNASFADVGLVDAPIGRTRSATTTVTAVVPTSERAVGGNVKACALR
jgi:Domain of unknown function (DUF4307)